jgi:hypothetical protein
MIGKREGVGEESVKGSGKRELDLSQSVTDE